MIENTLKDFFISEVNQFVHAPYVYDISFFNKRGYLVMDLLPNNDGGTVFRV